MTDNSSQTALTQPCNGECIIHDDIPCKECLEKANGIDNAAPTEKEEMQNLLRELTFRARSSFFLVE